MHDGSIASLEEVIERYVVAHKLQITSEDRANLIAFLHSLTDREFVTNPRFSDPSPASRERVARSAG